LIDFTLPRAATSILGLLHPQGLREQEFISWLDELQIESGCMRLADSGLFALVSGVTGSCGHHHAGAGVPPSSWLFNGYE
jgi:hypothetical protein